MNHGLNGAERDYDVVVCGGGLAGIGAACTAARAGVSTLLVERLESLGGLGTAGGVGNFCFGDASLPAGQGWVFSELWKRLSFYGAIGPEHGWPAQRSALFHNHPFDHNVLAIVLLELAEAVGVDLLFATDVIGAEVTGRTVRAAILHNRSLGQRVGAKVFIDCTGDGVLARHAGVPALPADPDHPQCIQPGQMVFLHSVPAPRPQAIAGEPSGLSVSYSVWAEPNRVGLKLKFPETDFDTSTGCGYSEACRAFRRRIPEFVRHFQQTESGRATVFDYSASMLGIRDGVRIAGNYILTGNDLCQGRHFADAVAHGCFPLDTATVVQKQSLPPYQIPYRCLTAQARANLLVAGRCLSATRMALSSTRIMATCCLTGQAAGWAASLAVRSGKPVGEVAPEAIRAALVADQPADEVLRVRLGV